MKTLPTPSRSPLSGVAALVAAAGLVLALAPAVRGNNPNGGSGGSGVNLNTNSVGTMPNLGVMPPQVLPPRDFPAFALTGPRDFLLDTLVDVSGEAEVYFILDPMSGQPRVEFRGGALDLLLDETHLASGVVTISVLAPDGSAMYAAFENSGYLSPVSIVQPDGAYSLDYAAWHGTHFTDATTTVHSLQGNARRMRHTLNSGAGLLTVGQHLQ